MPNEPRPEEPSLDVSMSSAPTLGGLRAESNQNDLQPVSIITRPSREVLNAARLRPKGPYFKPWKATYATISEDFIEDKKKEVSAGCVTLGAMLLSGALSFGRAWIAIPLFLINYPALGLGYLWLRGEEPFENFGDFVVESTTYSLFIFFAPLALLITLCVVKAVVEGIGGDEGLGGAVAMLAFALLLVAVLVIYCWVALSIVA